MNLRPVSHALGACAVGHSDGRSPAREDRRRCSPESSRGRVRRRSVGGAHLGARDADGRAGRTDSRRVSTCTSAPHSCRRRMAPCDPKTTPPPELRIRPHCRSAQRRARDCDAVGDGTSCRSGRPYGERAYSPAYRDRSVTPTGVHPDRKNELPAVAPSERA